MVKQLITSYTDIYIIIYTKEGWGSDTCKKARKPTCKGSKLEPNWTGPYHIAELVEEEHFGNVIKMTILKYCPLYVT